MFNDKSNPFHLRRKHLVERADKVSLKLGKSRLDLKILISCFDTSDLAKMLLQKMSPGYVDAITDDADFPPKFKDDECICVVWDDFLTYFPYKRYDLVLLDVPLNEDVDKYLEHAKTLVKPGGFCIYTRDKTVCVYEKDKTPKPPEFILGKRTDGEPGEFVYLQQPEESFPKSGTGLGMLEPAEGNLFFLLRRFIEGYRFSVNAGLTLLAGHRMLTPYVAKEWEIWLEPEKANQRCSIPWAGRGWLSTDPDDFVQAVNEKYWSLLKDRMGLWYEVFRESMSSASCFLRQINRYEINLFTIRNVISLLSQKLIQSTDVGLSELFNRLSLELPSGAAAKGSKTFVGYGKKEWRYFDGEITTCSPERKGDVPKYGTNWRFLRQVDILLSLFMEMQNIICDPADILEGVENKRVIKNVELKFITFSLSRNGTMKILFKNPKVLRCFNIFHLRKAGALPAEYGKIPYEDFAESDRAVIDAYEGEKAYREVYENNYFYIRDTAGIEVFQPRALLDVFMRDMEKYCTDPPNE